MAQHRGMARVGTLPIATSLAALTLFLTAASPVVAAFPGENGALAVVREGEVRGIWTLSGFTMNRLTEAEDYRPRWSHDGRRIVFQRFEGNHSNIFVMDADGSDVTQLTTKGGFQPGWSPNGMRNRLRKFARWR
jgi:hypothetical protein